jgi:hypothetical protein
MFLLCCAVGLAETVLVDDEDGAPGFTTTGDDWTTWGMSGHGFDGTDSSYHYLSHTLGGSDRRGTATWTPELPVAGIWRVETWFRATENRTSNAQHLLYDRDGYVETVTLDQRGEGGSGWVELGELACEAGQSSCWVTLDGTDDDESDEANAMRFVLVSEDEVPDEEEAEGCSEEPGEHTITLWAGSVSASGWSDASSAEGEADGKEAHSENVDAGEVLSAEGFGRCSLGTLTAVELGVRARTQYDSGTYALELLLSAAGVSRVFTGTTASWTTLSLPASSWEEIDGLQASVQLHDHPGGERDSDAWVDAFRLSVTYTIEDPDEDPDAGTQDTGAEAWDTGSPDPAGDGDEGRDRQPRDLSEADPARGCSAAPRAWAWPGLLAALLGVGRRRRQSGRSTERPARACSERG